MLEWPIADPKPVESDTSFTNSDLGRFKTSPSIASTTFYTLENQIELLLDSRYMRWS